MKCEKCGSDTWVDDDLHWDWCKNPKCSEHYGNNYKTRVYFETVNEKDQRMRERMEERGELEDLY